MAGEGAPAGDRFLRDERVRQDAATPGEDQVRTLRARRRRAWRPSAQEAVSHRLHRRLRRTFVRRAGVFAERRRREARAGVRVPELQRQPFAGGRSDRAPIRWASLRWQATQTRRAEGPRASGGDREARVRLRHLLLRRDLSGLHAVDARRRARFRVEDIPEGEASAGDSCTSHMELGLHARARPAGDVAGD